MKGKHKNNGQDKASGSNVDAPGKNLFYALTLREEYESFPIWLPVCYMFSLLMYMILLDPGDTLSFVTPLIARKFDILPDILNEPFMVTNPVGELTIANRV